MMRLSTLSCLAATATLVLFACPDPQGPGTLDRSFTADPDLIDFGYVAAGGSTDPVAIDLVNETNGDVQIQNILVSEGTQAFSLFSQPPTLPVELSPGEDLQISAYFAPPDSGVYLGTIEILTADADQTLTIDLGGCSTDPDCQVDFGSGDDDDATDDDDAVDDDDAAGSGTLTLDPATALDFGQQPQNGSSVQELLNMTNSGSDTLNVSSIRIEGTDAGQFNTGGFAGGPINVDATIPLAVQFSPVGSLGMKSATIIIESDSSDGPSHEISISAEVIEDCGDCLPVLEVDGATTIPNPIPGLGPAQLVHLGGLSAGSVTVTVRNTGFGTLSVSSVTEGGTIVADDPTFSYDGGTPLPWGLTNGDEATLDFTIGSAGCEVINFDGSYAFTIGIPADATGCFL